MGAPPSIHRLAGLVALVALGPVGSASAQTLSEVAAAQTACTTAGGEVLSRQLVDVQTCLHPGQFVSFASSNVTATSNRVHLFGQASAAAAIAQAAASVPLMINSGFRPLSDQYLLATSGQCGVVASPGSSNHQSGRAIDVQNTVAARAALQAAGCVWFGSTDAVHYDCPGTDQRGDAIAAFQRLWNLNRPSMPLDEDGVYGPMTAAALAASPAAGFPVGSASVCAEAAPDAGMPDAGSADGGLPDAGPLDLGPPDTGGPPPDAGAQTDAGLDAAPEGAHDEPAGCGCHVVGARPSTPSPGWALAASLLLARRLRARRRRAPARHDALLTPRGVRTRPT